MANNSKRHPPHLHANVRFCLFALQDPTKPKRAMSAFFIFSQANRQRIKEENPEASFGDLVSKTISIFSYLRTSRVFFMRIRCGCGVQLSACEVFTHCVDASCLTRCSSICERSVQSRYDHDA
jgi:hypothetical protein